MAKTKTKLKVHTVGRVCVTVADTDLRSRRLTCLRLSR